MNTTCPRCGAVVDANSSFCTNCGSVIAAPNPYQQQPVSQVPPWSNAGGYNYQQQQQTWSGQNNPSTGGSLGFGGANDAIVKKVITWVALAILGTIVLLIFLGVLALLIPGLRCLFLVLLVLVFLIPWIIYVNIRNYIRRTVGRLGRFF
jgi:ribosomal protein S27AE